MQNEEEKTGCVTIFMNHVMSNMNSNSFLRKNIENDLFFGWLSLFFVFGMYAAIAITFVLITREFDLSETINILWLSFEYINLVNMINAVLILYLLIVHQPRKHLNKNATSILSLAFILFNIIFILRSIPSIFFCIYWASVIYQLRGTRVKAVDEE